MSRPKPRCAPGDTHDTRSTEATEVVSLARFSTLEQQCREIAVRTPMHVSRFVQRPDT
jgi:hypothetical protein